MEISRLLQPCENLALAFARYTQPCDHPLQGAHNLAKIEYSYCQLYNLA